MTILQQNDDTREAAPISQVCLSARGAASARARKGWGLRIGKRLRREITVADPIGACRQIAFGLDKLFDSGPARFKRNE